MSNTYDLVVIGAGINGCGVAKLASESGKKVMLLEQYDAPARGTSGKSSKLIHGGLRYLESGELHFVYKSLRERKYMLKNYPDIVKIKPFFIPVYSHSKRSRFWIWSGLLLYGALGFFKKYSRFRILPKSEYAGLDGLKLENLKSVYQYYDAQTDDVKLTNAVLKDAIAAGTTVKFSHPVDTIKLEENLSTVKCENGFSVCARAVINAAGPWINLLLDKTSPEQQRLAIDLVQGTHLVIKGKLTKGLYYIEAADGRAVFVLPWHDNTLIGTTEKLHVTAPKTAKPTQEEIDYLINTYNYYFPGANKTKSDILETMAGLRVLPQDKSSAFSRSREVKILSDRKLKPRLISVYGGKLTSWHSTASKVLSALG